MSVYLIAAIDEKTKALGKDGSLVFTIKDDMKHFVAATTGHTIVMGRKTWESFPPERRPLKNRVNVVISRDPNYQAPGATVYTSLHEALLALDAQNSAKKIYVIGGGEIYTEALRLADEFPTELDLTIVRAIPPLTPDQYDVIFPEFEHSFAKVEEELHDEHIPPYSFTRWKHK